MGPEALAQVLRRLPRSTDPDYLNREQHFSDAGVYRISDSLALVQTVDFFTPVVDDPYTFGQIAAANALSDVYALGGRPLTALNMICFPASCTPLTVMEEILLGGYDKVAEADAVMVGGHSLEDAEPKYGLAVTGTLDPRRMITSGGGQPGDRLVLTKPLGTGIITTAIKGGLIGAGEAVQVVEGMASLNRIAAEAMLKIEVSACTDISGFGLLGHLHEMLLSSGVSALIESGSVPFYGRVDEMTAMGMIPAGAYRNLEYVRPHLDWSGQEESRDNTLVALADPQTSGGLLVALSPNKTEPYLELLGRRGIQAAPVGWLTGDPGNRISIK